MIIPHIVQIMENTKKGMICNWDIEVKNLPGGVGHESTKLFAAIRMNANDQIVPIREINPPIITLFI